MRLLLVTLVLALNLASSALAGQRLIRACDNNEDYPPFRWREKAADGRVQIKGLGHSVLRQILAKHGWRLEIELLPLRRCLQEVASGERYQIVISSSQSVERERLYLLSAPYDYVHFHSIYLERRFPSGSPVKTKKDLRRHRICTLAGHNFSMFELAPEQISAEVESFAAAFAMLRHERCDVLPYNIETIKGFRLIGEDFLGSGEFGHALIQDMAPAPILMLIAKPYRYSTALQNLINSELAAMKASGELQKLKSVIQSGGTVNPVLGSPVLGPPSPASKPRQ